MRTLVIVSVLVAVALAALASFVVRGGAQEPEGVSAEMGGGCDGSRVTRGTDSVVTCLISAINTGGERIEAPRLVFVPAPNVPIPERYFFFSETLDGETKPTTGADTVYEFNPIDPGQSSRIEFEIIVNASGTFGAEIQLADETHGLLDRQTFVITPPESAVSTRLRVVRDDSDSLSAASAAFRIEFADSEVGTIPHASVEAHPGASARVSDTDRGTRGPTGRWLFEVDDIVTPGGFSVSFSTESTDGECLYATPAAVARITIAGDPLTLAALAPPPSGCGGTSSFGASGVMSLGQGGFGPERTAVESSLALLAMLAGALGFAAVGVGIYVVR
jgi:hypothetical protein